MWMRANTHYIQKAHNDYPAVEPAVFGSTHTQTHIHAHGHPNRSWCVITANQQQLASWEEGEQPYVFVCVCD